MNVVKIKKTTVVARAKSAPSQEGKNNFFSDKMKEEIAKKAYELYASRGYSGNRDLDDWLEAEKIVSQERK
jgi:hypothetical protein